MNFKKSGKGMSQVMWILIALVIALVVAVVVILIFRTGAGNAGQQGDTAITGSGRGANLEICQASCETCKRLGNTCTWSEFGKDCVEKGILENCNP